MSHKITYEQIVHIKSELDKGRKIVELAAEMNVATSTISYWKLNRIPKRLIPKQN